MIIKFNSELVAIIPVAFENVEGETVSYNELFLVNENDEGRKEMLKFNSKLDISKLSTPKNVDIEVDIDNTGERKPKLLSIK